MLKTSTKQQSEQPFSITGILRLLFLILLCSGSIFLASQIYCASTFLRLIITAVQTPLLATAIRRQFRAHRFKTAREQFKWFLELLLTELSAGTSFENAFSQTVLGMTDLLKSRSLFLKLLQSVDQKIKINQPIAPLLRTISSQMPVSDAVIFFNLLPEIMRFGCPITDFVRHQLHHTTEQLSVLQNQNAETTQRKTEATILVFFPFFVTVLLKNSWNADTNQLTMIAGQFATGLLALTAVCLTIGLSAFSENNPQSVMPKIGRLQRLTKAEHKLCKGMQFVYKNWLPAAYGSGVLHLISDLNNLYSTTNSNLTDWPSFYFRQKLRLMLSAWLPALILISQNSALWPLIVFLPLFTAYLHDLKWLKIRQNYALSYSKNYPVLLNLWSALLGTGLSLSRSLNISCSAMLKSTNERQLSSADLNLINMYLQTGQSTLVILERLLTICPVPEVQTALLLLIRYEKLGGSEALQMIQLQSASLWHIYHSAIKTQLEKQSVLLLVPMMISLLCVILSALLPAIISLQSF